MSKANYYVIAVYSFGMLLTELCMAPKEEKKRRLLMYFSLLGATALVFLILYIPDFVHYGFRRSSIIMDVRNTLAIPELNLSSSPEIQGEAINLYGKGVSLKEFLMYRGLHKTLFRSFCGTYGGLKFQGSDWYYCLQGMIYLGLWAGMTVCIWKEKGFKEQKIKYIILQMCGILSYLLVLYNAYFIDFQAQGRYMLPVLIFLAHAVSLKKEMTEKKWFKILLCASFALSLWSYFTICLPNIIYN